MFLQHAVFLLPISREKLVAMGQGCYNAGDEVLEE